MLQRLVVILAMVALVARDADSTTYEVTALQVSPVVGPPSPTDCTAPRPRTTARRELLIDTAWIVGGQGLDAGTTIYALHHGLRESNPFVGRQPSTPTILLTKAVIAGAGIWFCREARAHGHPRIARVFAVAIGTLGGTAGTANTWTIYIDR